MNRAARTDAAVLPRTDRAITAALLLLTTMIAFENMAVATAMPVVAAELGALGSYGLAFSSMMTAMLLGIVLAGPWTDRAGPLPPVFVGQALFAIGAVLCGAAPSFGILLLGRVITGSAPGWSSSWSLSSSHGRSRPSSDLGCSPGCPRRGSFRRSSVDRSPAGWRRSSTGAGSSG